METSYKLYCKYEYLVHHYANKVNIFDLSLEKEDIIQELRIKLFQSIKNYAKKWKFYKDTGKRKPIPLVYYLKTVMNNRVKDFIKLNNRDSVVNNVISIDRDSFDCGFNNSESICDIDFSRKVIRIDNIDFLEGMKEHEKGCLCFYLKGYPKMKVSKVFKNKFDGGKNVINFIEKEVERLKRHSFLKELNSENKNFYYSITPTESNQSY